MTDNIIDITNKLQLEVRLRWKEQMALVRTHDEEIMRIVNSLSGIRREWAHEKLPFPGVARSQARDFERAITLLLCASEKLMQAVPFTDEEIEEARRALQSGE
jgi:hypothetical protein